jgi:site-specific DNA recombinase
MVGAKQEQLKKLSRARSSQVENAVVYCRVSSKEQSENLSLASQEQACRRHAECKGYNILRVFVNRSGESAKSIDRQGLQQLLKFAAKEHRKVDALIVWKLDRLSRDMADFTRLIELLARLRIRVESVTENVDESSAGRFMRNMLASMAQYENDVKSERTIAGMKQAMREGRWPWRAPIGYEHVKGVYGKSVLKPDEKAPFIKMAFELAEKGIFSQVEICRDLRRHGFKVSKQHLNRILRNSIYASIIIKKDWLAEPVRAIHDPLITEEQFHRVQQILDGKRPTLKPQMRNNPDFPLRRFIICPQCREGITGSFSRGRRGNRYPYYHCRIGGCGFGSVPRDDLHSQFLERLSSVKPSPGALNLFAEIVRDVWTTEHQRSIEESRQLENRVHKLQEQRKRALELVLSGVLDEHDYREASEGLREQIVDLRTALDDLHFELADVDDCVGYCTYLLSNVTDLWETADIDLRQRFQRFVFPEGIQYFRGFVGTPKTSMIFNILGDKEPEKSRMASPRGFEPLFTP